MASGQLPQSQKASNSRFAEKLEFTHIYFNQFQAKKLEDLITEAKKVNASIIHDQIESLRDADQQLIAQT